MLSICLLLLPWLQSYHDSTSILNGCLDFWYKCSVYGFVLFCFVCLFGGWLCFWMFIVWSHVPASLGPYSGNVCVKGIHLYVWPLCLISEIVLFICVTVCTSVFMRDWPWPFIVFWAEYEAEECVHIRKSELCACTISLIKLFFFFSFLLCTPSLPPVHSF